MMRFSFIPAAIKGLQLLKWEEKGGDKCGSWSLVATRDTRTKKSSSLETAVTTVTTVASQNTLKEKRKKEKNWETFLSTPVNVFQSASNRNSPSALKRGGEGGGRLHLFEKFFTLPFFFSLSVWALAKQ
jgi:hypothetical protein